MMTLSTAVGVVILGVAAAAVTWRMKPEQKAGNEGAGHRHQKIEFQKKPGEQGTHAYHLVSENVRRPPPPWMVIHTTPLISHKTISNLPPFPCHLILLAVWSGLTPTAFYSTLRDCSPVEGISVITSFLSIVCFLFLFLFFHLSILLHPHSLSDFLRG